MSNSVLNRKNRTRISAPRFKASVMVLMTDGGGMQIMSGESISRRL
jgi:hypothetical protein